MRSSFQWAMVFGMTLAAAILFISGRHPVTYASSRDASECGAVLFQTKGCEGCHRITGIGGDRAPDLSSVGQRRKSDDIRAQILRGGHGMPPFKGVLAKDEVKDLVRFLTSCRSDTPPGCRQRASSQSPQ